MKSILTILGLASVWVNLNGCATDSNLDPGSPTANAGGAGGTGNTSSGIPTNNGGSGASIFTSGTGTENCSGPNPPKSCGKKATPGCGDGLINQDSEACDDGNALAGDGCNGLCIVEPYHVCPTPGQPCVVSFRCGDGVVNPGEACDQGNDAQAQGVPGCSADCTKQDAGYKCIPNQACTPNFVCGNGRIETGETCDPPNVGNGCGTDCKAETGWRCKPGSCVPKPAC
ncbi:MAG TPA: DUF4215 domain-containing protein, partial [Polyangiaceae bacterium]